MKTFDCIVLGAGAAGMFAASEAGKRGLRVLLLEHRKTVGEKIRISGGGRCNFTNLGISGDRFLSQNPRFSLSALNRYTQWDFIRKVERAGISWHEKTKGQLFCDGSANQIVKMLSQDLQEARVELWVDCNIEAVSSGFVVQTSRGVVRAPKLIVATGGKSIPKIGATGLGYRIAETFGIPLIETRPGLVPLTFATQDIHWMSDLAGISIEGRVAAGHATFDEALLFTHRGLSGPAILQASNYWREGQEVRVNLTPGIPILDRLKAAKLASGKQALRTVLASLIPERLAKYLEADMGISLPLAELSTANLERVANRIQGWALKPVGSEGYRTAEVTLGGIDTRALDGRTMEAKAVPGLYFVGEVVDVTGWLGGYNFQWAWSSGWVAGQSV